MNELSRRRFIELSLYLFAYASLGGCRTNTVPVLGKDRLSNILKAEDHSEFLADWAEQGIRDAVLINIDTHDDIRWIPDEKIQALQQLYNAGDWKQFRASNTMADNGLYHIGNWIYAGAKLGIFKKVYWIAPFSLFEHDSSEESIRQFMQALGFTTEELQLFKLRGKQFSGNFHGIPLTVCSLADLPAIKEPALLSIDTDFFPQYVQDHNCTLLAALRDTFTALYSQRYPVKKSAVCYSVNGGYLEVRHRWVGDAATDILGNPDSVFKAPGKLLDSLQKLDAAFMQEDTAKMLEVINSFHSAETAPAILLYKAYAHVLLEQTEHAYATATELCKANPIYSPIFPRIASFYAGSKRYRDAERFFRTGYSLKPDLDLGLVDFALCLRETGRLHEAVEYFTKEVQVRGSYPVEFMISNTYIMLDNRTLARKHLHAAIKSLARSRYRIALDQCTVDDINAVLRYCDETGLVAEAAMIRNSQNIIRKL